MKLNIFGPPGSGKGTQASLICDDFGLLHLSTGDVLRKEIKNKSPLGEAAKTYIDAGMLVPDEIVVGIIQSELGDRQHFLLDGYPRTVPQAEFLQDKMSFDRILYLNVDPDECAARMTSRMICGCGATYGLEVKPKKEGYCDNCESVLTKRSDDNDPEAVKTRIMTYNSKTLPVLDFYRPLGIVKEIDAACAPQQVFAQIQRELNSLRSEAKIYV